MAVFAVVQPTPPPPPSDNGHAALISQIGFTADTIDQVSSILFLKLHKKDMNIQLLFTNKSPNEWTSFQWPLRGHYSIVSFFEILGEKLNCFNCVHVMMMLY